MKDSPITRYFYINDSLISTKATHKDLGLIASADLSWSIHYQYLASRAYRTLTFKSANSIKAKRMLYLTLIRTQLLYCSQVWRPHLIKDIVLLKKIQRRATKFILVDYTSDYKTRLLALDMLPLMAELEINDIMFDIRNLNKTGDHFNITSYVSFSQGTTRSGIHSKMCHTRSRTSLAHHLYFNKLPRLWNSQPPFDLRESPKSLELTGSDRKLVQHRNQSFGHRQVIRFSYEPPTQFN